MLRIWMLLKKARYDLDVMKNQKLLKLCDGCITTTLALKKELEKYNPNVWINRNTASIEMVTLSQEIKKHQKILWIWVTLVVVLRTMKILK